MGIIAGQWLATSWIKQHLLGVLFLGLLKNLNLIAKNTFLSSYFTLRYFEIIYLGALFVLILVDLLSKFGAFVVTSTQNCSNVRTTYSQRVTKMEINRLEKTGLFKCRINKWTLPLCKQIKFDQYRPKVCSATEEIIHLLGI